MNPDIDIQNTETMIGLSNYNEDWNSFSDDKNMPTGYNNYKITDVKFWAIHINKFFSAIKNNFSLVVSIVSIWGYISIASSGNMDTIGKYLGYVFFLFIIYIYYRYFAGNDNLYLLFIQIKENLRFKIKFFIFFVPIFIVIYQNYDFIGYSINYLLKNILSFLIFKI